MAGIDLGVTADDLQKAGMAVILGFLSLVMTQVTHRLGKIRESQKNTSKELTEAKNAAKKAAAEVGNTHTTNLRDDMDKIADAVDTIRNIMVDQYSSLLERQERHEADNIRSQERTDNALTRLDENIHLLRREFQVTAEREAREHEILHERIRKLKSQNGEGGRRGKHV